mgnify:FL=1
MNSAVYFAPDHADYTEAFFSVKIDRGESLFVKVALDVKRYFCFSSAGSCPGGIMDIR